VYGIGIGVIRWAWGVVAWMWMLTSPTLSERIGGGDIWFVANVGEEGLGDLAG